MMGAIVAAIATLLFGCSESRSPVTGVKVLEVSELPATPNAVALSPDGRLVVVGDLDGDLTARSVPTGTERWKVRVHPPGATRRIDGLVFSPDGSLLASTGQDAPAVELWRGAHRGPARRAQNPHNPPPPAPPEKTDPPAPPATPPPPLGARQTPITPT